MSGPPCPYFGKNSQACEVGCVPATPDHLEKISTLCAFSHRECGTYQDLVRRSNSALSGGIRPRSSQTVARETASLGLIYWGSSLLLLILAQSGLSFLSGQGLALLMAVSALTQIFAGLRAVAAAPARAVAFTGYGLFWLSMIALDVLPRAGIGTAPGSASLVPYLAVWSLFGFIICQEKSVLSGGCRLGFGLFSMALLFQAGSLFLDSTVLFRSGMVLGLHAGLLVLGCGLLPLAARKGRGMTIPRSI